MSELCWIYFISLNISEIASLQGEINMKINEIFYIVIIHTKSLKSVCILYL